MGDFNFGPNHEWRLNYYLLLEAGFANANIESNDNGKIDHVFVKNAATSNPQRVMNDTVTITLSSGETMNSHLSDHFGYQATVSYEEGKDYTPEEEFVHPDWVNPYSDENFGTMLWYCIETSLVMLAIIIIVGIIKGWCCWTDIHYKKKN